MHWISLRKLNLLSMWEEEKKVDHSAVVEKWSAEKTHTKKWRVSGRVPCSRCCSRCCFRCCGRRRRRCCPSRVQWTRSSREVVLLFPRVFFPVVVGHHDHSSRYGYGLRQRRRADHFPWVTWVQNDAASVSVGRRWRRYVCHGSAIAKVVIAWLTFWGVFFYFFFENGPTKIRRPANHCRCCRFPNLLESVAWNLNFHCVRWTPTFAVRERYKKDNGWNACHFFVTFATIARWYRKMSV